MTLVMTFGYDSRHVSRVAAQTGDPDPGGRLWHEEVGRALHDLRRKADAAGRRGPLVIHSVVRLPDEPVPDGGVAVHAWQIVAEAE